MDRSGNESRISGIICNDNCPQYILPNVFTPNNDGFNDTFKPLENDGQCPRFVDSVDLTIVNRAGREVFSIDTNNPEITLNVEWDGRINGGTEAPTGVYYYAAEVIFNTLNSRNQVQVIKGWVQLIR